MTTFMESGVELSTADLIYLTHDHCHRAYRIRSSKEKKETVLAVCRCLNKAGEDFCQSCSHRPVTSQVPMKSGDVVNVRDTLQLLSVEFYGTLAWVEAEVQAKDLTSAVECLWSNEVIPDAVPIYPLMEEIVSIMMRRPQSLQSHRWYSIKMKMSPTVYRPASILSMLTDDEAGRSRGRSSNLISTP